MIIDNRVAPKASVSAEKAFLGAEFLTWLLFKCDETSGTFASSDKAEMGIYVDDLLVLAGSDPKGQVDSFKGGAPASSPEAGAALLGGKKVVKARLIVAQGPKEWVLTIDQHLDVRALRVPPAEADDAMEREEELLAGLEEVMVIIDDLFARFLQVRLHDSWEQREVGRLQAWVRTRGQEVCHV